ncbi:MAG: hypothetical protein WCR85_00310 [Sphaerochaeta sp.]
MIASIWRVGKDEIKRLRPKVFAEFYRIALDIRERINIISEIKGGFTSRIINLYHPRKAMEDLTFSEFLWE